MNPTHSPIFNGHAYEILGDLLMEAIRRNVIEVAVQHVDESTFEIMLMYYGEPLSIRRYSYKEVRARKRIFGEKCQKN